MVVIIIQVTYHNPFRRTGMNEFVIFQINAHMADFRASNLKKDEIAWLDAKANFDSKLNTKKLHENST